MLQIESLQLKIKDIQGKIEEQENKIILQQKETEPNFQVLSTWLQEYHQRKEQKKIKEEIETKYRQFKNGTSNATPEEKKILQEPLLKLPEMFHCKQSTGIITPSPFMLQFIEATYNLLKIQDERIKTLEPKLV